jgi:uncharacterized protein (TIGR02246 family)
MKSKAIQIITTYSLFLMAICVSTVSVAQTAKDKQAVKNVIAAFQDDFNEGTYKNVNNYTTTDWEHINPIGGQTIGRDAVLKELLPLHQTILKGVTMSTENTTIRFLAPTVAMVNVVHKIGDYELPAGVKHHDEHHMKTYIVVKKQGRWLLTLDQNNVIVPQ